METDRSVADVLGKYQDLDPTNALLPEADAAIVLDVAAGTLQNWRSTGRTDLRYIKVGGKIRYRLTDIQDFLRTRARGGPHKRKQKGPRHAVATPHFEMEQRSINSKALSQAVEELRRISSALSKVVSTVTQFDRGIGNE